MPNIDSERLMRISHDILIKHGASEDEASTVAKKIKRTRHLYGGQ